MTANTTAGTALGDLLDRLLDAGAVVAGDLVIGIADVELLLVDLRLLLTGVESARQRGCVPHAVLHHAPRSGVQPDELPALPRRLDLEDERPGRGLVGLVLLLVDILRQLLQGQALARLEGGSLTADEAERLGAALRRLDERIDALRRWVRDETPAAISPTEGAHQPWR